MSDQSVDEGWLEVYLYESTTLMEQLELIIITCEKEKHFNKENINEIFRIMHTIKGSSAMMNYSNIASVAHSLEDLFYYFREEEPEVLEYSKIADFVLSGIDFIKEELGKIQEEKPVDGNEDDLVSDIKTYLNLIKKNEPVTSGEQKNTEQENSWDKNCSAYIATIYFQEGCEMENIRAYTIIHNMPADIINIVHSPADILENEKTINIIQEQGFQIEFETNMDYELVYEMLVGGSFVKSVTLIKREDALLKSEEKNVVVSEPVNESGNSGKVHSMISVSVDKLDRLLDLIGEIVIAEDMVIQNPDIAGLKLDNFKKAANQLGKITSDIQALVMEIRMVPLQATFLKMNRVVRDVSKKLNKEVELNILGEQTEVDKKIIELISDPIMHLVRNSLDHGIEESKVRESKGKNRIGSITLEAKNEGSDVIIHVKDNGRGLNKDKILEKALEQGLIRPDVTLSDKEIYNLVLLPGFSTKEEVTEFSGRGVGMDVVAKNIESIGGSLYVESEADVGTTITLKIPLTLAIIDGMNIKVGKSRYTIPTISIKETFRPKGNEIIKDPNGNEMIMVRGKCYNIRKLYEMYQVETEITEYTKGIIVMVQQDDKMIAIFADELIGQQQVVVKSLPEYMKRFEKKESGLAGCTLLGDGSISLILDIGKMLSFEKYR